MDINKGDSLTFSGFPAKVKDRVLVVVRSIEQGDKVAQINRQPQRPAEAQPAAASDKAQQGQSQEEQKQQQQQQQQQQQGTQNPQ